jgi:hypothetical protein
MEIGRCKTSAALPEGSKSYSEIEQSNFQPSEFPVRKQQQGQTPARVKGTR